MSYDLTLVLGLSRLLINYLVVVFRFNQLFKITAIIVQFKFISHFAKEHKKHCCEVHKDNQRCSIHKGVQTALYYVRVLYYIIL